jgi:hypothetical protein
MKRAIKWLSIGQSETRTGIDNGVIEAENGGEQANYPCPRDVWRMHGTKVSTVKHLD